MVLATGLDNQFGMATESAYGTAVTVTRFYEMDGAPTFNPDVRQIKVRGAGRGRTQRSGQVVTYIGRPTIEIPFVVFDRNMGLLFKHCVGAVATTGSETPWSHAFTKGTTGTKGLSATLQLALPDITGTRRPHNFPGSKVTSFTLSSAIGEALKIATNWTAQTFETSTAVASASYASGALPLTFVHGAAEIDGNAVSIKDIELEVDQGLVIERDFQGNAKSEPLPGGELVISGTFGFEFEGRSRTTELVAGTIIEDVELSWTRGAHSLTVTIPEMIYSEGAGEPSDSDANQQPMQWFATDDGSNEIMTITYVSPDENP